MKYSVYFYIYIYVYIRTCFLNVLISYVAIVPVFSVYMGSKNFLYLEETACKIKSHGKWSSLIESLKVGNRAYELVTDAVKCQEPIIQDWCHSKWKFHWCYCTLCTLGLAFSLDIRLQCIVERLNCSYEILDYILRLNYTYSIWQGRMQDVGHFESAIMC